MTQWHKIIADKLFNDQTSSKQPGIWKKFNFVEQKNKKQYNTSSAVTLLIEQINLANLLTEMPRNISYGNKKRALDVLCFRRWHGRISFHGKNVLADVDILIKNGYEIIIRFLCNKNPEVGGALSDKIFIFELNNKTFNAESVDQKYLFYD